MRTIVKGVALLAGALLVLGACSDDDGGGDEGTPRTTSSRDVIFNVALSGGAEAPGPGDPDGTGRAQITVVPGGTEVCAILTVENLDEVTGAHIHEGRAGTAGPIAVTLPSPIEGSAEECVTASGSIVEGLSEGNRSFYVNVHTSEYPDGAVRAQLTGTS
jgi:hypothetical protein